jgi:hypothetical protein
MADSIGAGQAIQTPVSATPPGGAVPGQVVPVPGIGGGNWPTPIPGVVNESGTPGGATSDQLASSNLQFSSIDDALLTLQGFSKKELNLYKKGQLAPGTQAAIDLAAQSGLGALTGQLASEGIDPATSSQYAGGAEQIALQKSIATQNALEKILQNYFTAQGMQMQAAEILGNFNQFDQTLALQYAQLAIEQEQVMIQAQEFQQQQKQQSKGMMGQLAGSVGGLLGGGKGGCIAVMAAIHELMKWLPSL